MRAYLQLLWALPWNKRAHEEVALRSCREGALERDQLGLARAKERIVEYLAVRKLKHDLPGPALCLGGPSRAPARPRSAGRWRARSDRPFVRINVSGTTGADELIGHQPHATGRPARPASCARCGTPASRTRSSSSTASIVWWARRASSVVELLLELLDPEYSSHFTDLYLGMPIDLYML